MFDSWARKWLAAGLMTVVLLAASACGFSFGGEEGPVARDGQDAANRSLDPVTLDQPHPELEEANYAAFLMAWDLAEDPDQSVIWRSGAFYNMVGFDHERSDELLEQGRSLLSIAERRPVYQEWAKLMNEQVPYLFLYSRHRLIAARTDRIDGLDVNVLGALWNPEELQLTGDETLDIAMWSEPSGVFNPNLTIQSYDREATRLVYESLLRYNSQLELVPHLAERFEISPDNRTITFELRNDVYWHDGEPFDAEDVAFTFKSMFHPDYPLQLTGELPELVGLEAYRSGESDTITGLRVMGDYRIQFELIQPRGPALSQIGLRPIMAEHAYRNVAVEDMKSAVASTTDVLGTGPYRFSGYEQGRWVRLEANPNWWRSGLSVPQVVYRIASEEEAVNLLKSGGVDLAGTGPSLLDPQQVDSLNRDENIRVFELPSFRYDYVGLNNQLALFDDQRVRQALHYAVDRRGMVESLLSGRGTVVNSPVLPVSWAYTDDLNPYPYDLETAQRLLNDAGWEDRDGDGTLEHTTGYEFRFPLLYPQTDTVRQKTAEWIQDDLQQAGIEVELEPLPLGQLEQVIIQGPGL